MSVLLFISRKEFEQRKASKRHIAYLKVAEEYQLTAMANCKMTDIKFCFRTPSREELIFDKSNFFLVREELSRRNAQ